MPETGLAGPIPARTARARLPGAYGRGMRITVLDGYTINPGDNPWTPLEGLAEVDIHDRTAADQILGRAAGSPILLTNKTLLSRQTIERLPELRYIGVLATGYNVVDTAAARERGIVVTNIPAYSTESVAQHAFALLLSLVNRPRDHDAAIRAGEWQSRGDFSFTLSPLVELAGKTMGIVGYGRIGRRMGEIARAFGMNVVANTRTRPAQGEPASSARAAPPTYDDGTPWLAIPELFAHADVVSLHAPQTAENAGFVNRDLLKRMKPTALLINTARGGLVNEADLAAALAEGVLAGAGLDVLTEEPPQTDNPLLSAPNCLITPHVAWATVEARQRLMRIAVDNVRAFLDGMPQNVVS